MIEGHGHDLLPADTERAVDGAGHDLRQPAAFLGHGIEGVRECLPDVGHRPRIAVARHRALLHVVEAPHVVQAQDVIGVAVSEDDGVDSPNAVRQRLFAQVRPGVHEHGRSVVERDEDRRAAAGDRASRSIDRFRSRSRSSARRSTFLFREK